MTTTCPGCGGPREEYTPGCSRCSARHSRLRAQGEPRRKRPKPRKTEDEIRATTEHNRRALDAWLQARLARLNPENNHPREAQ